MPEPAEPNGPVRIDESWYVRAEGLTERISAGGLVVRVARGDVLAALVCEQGLEGYVLPKGGVEPGESLDDAALREIHEETGLEGVEKLADLATLERLNRDKTLWSINHYGLYYAAEREGPLLDTAQHFGFGWFPLHDLPQMAWPDERDLLASTRRQVVEAVLNRQNPKPRKRRFM